MTLINVTLYYRQGDAECQKVIGYLENIAFRMPHNLIKIDIDSNEDLKYRFMNDVPVVRVGPYMLHHSMTQQDLEVALGAAKDRAGRLEEAGDKRYLERVDRGQKFSSIDHFAFWLSRHYLALFNFILFLYVGLPFLAPTFMKEGLTAPAKIIYTLYSPFCHQLAFRSFFLFGEQPYYPRTLAGMNVISYEAIMGLNPAANEKTDAFILNARGFVGNDTAGYKVAICERDIAMYGSLLLFGLIFGISGKRIKQVPWYVWLLIGMVPIAIDGFSQLPGLLSGLPAFLPNRESTPFLRVLTGGLFGFFTAWFLYPLIELNMKDTRSIFTSKATAISQISARN
jgi:uncharacterized membrane protein